MQHDIKFSPSTTAFLTAPSTATDASNDQEDDPDEEKSRIPLMQPPVPNAAAQARPPAPRARRQSRRSIPDGFSLSFDMIPALLEIPRVSNDTIMVEAGTMSSNEDVGSMRDPLVLHSTLAMSYRARPLTIALFLASLLLPSLAHAEPVVRCTYRDDRPDLGSPVHAKKGGWSLQHRLPNGTGVTVLKRSGNWNRIQYADPGPPVRSEPLRFYGWISKRYLKACPYAVAASMTKARLAALRAALDRTRSAPADEHLTPGPLEASMLVGMTLDEIEQALSDPGRCRVAPQTICDPNTDPVECREEMRAQPAPCQSETDVFYSFYHLPEGWVGGGPELLLRFEGERCVSATWRFTQ